MATKYTEYKPKAPLLGVFKDMENHPIDIPPLGWRSLDHLYVIDQTIKKFPGWIAYGSLESANPITFGFDFKKFNGSRHLVTASKSNIFYTSNRSTGVTTSILDLASEYPSIYPNTTNTHRWQSATLNDKLYLTNGTYPILEYTDGAVAALTADSDLPLAAKYIISSVGHLILGYTVETGGTYPRRVRWSKIDDPNTWIADSTTNDAGFFDMPEDIGELTGMANLGPNAFVVYGTQAIYLLSFQGLPLIWSQERKVVKEGLYMPYSLIAFNDRHYFIDSNDFKMFEGGAYAKRLGIDRVSTFFFEDFNSSDLSYVYGFAHPILPIVGWGYVQRQHNSYAFGKALLYNYANDTWSERSSFPHWAVWTFYDTIQQPDAYILMSAGELL